MGCCCHHKEEEPHKCCQSGAKHLHECGCKHKEKHECESHQCGCGKKSESFLSEKSRLLISLAALVLSFCISQEWIGWIHFPLSDPSWIAVILCGLPIAKSARESLIENGKITAPLLITTAMLAAILLQFIYLANPEAAGGHSHSSYIFAAGEIAFLMALGEMLEEYTVGKSRKGIERLASLSPQKALLKRGNETVEIEASEIKPNDILVVLPYSEIPADGVILEGSTSVNQSNLTGESVPVEKSAGDSVLAGTFNAQNRIEIKALKDASQSAIAKMIALVKEAEGKRAPIARIADKWASYIVPAAILFSILTGLFAHFALGKAPVESITRGVTILVVFCPCALVLATPTAIAAGIGLAAKRGILIKSATALEELGKCKTFAFDKTGTLTMGKISVRKVIANAPFGESDVLKYASSAEASSTHPIAHAILKFAEEKSISPLPSSNQKVLPGFGVECECEGQKVYVGKPDAGELKKMPGGEWQTLAVVKAGGKTLGYIAFEDKLKENAADAVKSILKSADCVMLTGDNEKSAEKTAHLAGIKTFYANMLPDGKLKAIEELKKSGKVCMVGDGVNDAPSLAYADCSISMGNLGSDIALENAEIIIMNDNLASIPKIFALSKRVILTIKTNITISMSVNILAVILAAYGVLNPVTGAIWHNLASVMVVLNSARILNSSKNS